MASTDQLVPHSAEWFEALGSSNPGQALQTEILVWAAGSPSVCSPCGHGPARDVRISHDPQASRPAPTLRLCEDCRSYRHEFCGETYVPLDA